ncbi:MAG: SGNH/GDSL hydrolase family protein [Candidatus Woesearchaeota archaeon]
MVRLCVWGDSITWGACDDEYGGWVNRLSLFEEVDVYNLGVSGDTTEHLLKRFDTECEAREPDVIVFAIGINDSANINGEPWVPLDKFEENIKELVRLARKYTSKVFFVGLTPVDEKLVKPVPWDTTISYDNQTIKQYDMKLREVVEYYIPLVLSDSDLADGLHPNARGHEKMFQQIKKNLRI